VNLTSIRLITDDVDRLVEFYETVTGVVAARPAPVFAEFRAETGTLAIASSATVAMLGDKAPKPGPDGSTIVEFMVADVDAEFDRIRAVIGDVVLPPTTMPWGNRSTLFRDPDGTLVNLFSLPTS